MKRDVLIGCSRSWFVGKVAVAVTCLFTTGCTAGAQVTQPAPGPYTENLSGTTASFEMVPVPPGMMPDSAGNATIPTPGFWISSFEVTWDVYDVYVFGLDRGAGPDSADALAKPSKPYVLPGDDFGHAGMPALGMTARAAFRFADWLSAKTGHEYRILKEAEWEYACRVAAEGAAADVDALDGFAWYRDNVTGGTQKPGQKSGGDIGVFDILGNAAEWVRGRDGTPVVKGGSYLSAAGDVTCSSRRAQTRAWNMTDPQIPKSPWWLSDAPFVTLRIARDYAP